MHKQKKGGHFENKLFTINFFIKSMSVWVGVQVNTYRADTVCIQKNICVYTYVHV